KKHSRLKTGAGSYLASHDPRMVLGLGQADTVESIEIQWPKPSRRVEKLTDVAADRYITVIEGKGIL
ncbi:MAG: ASPIC/UnbV domain-containing protein, partial [Bryobacterales bacterium]